jgi:hypothetical protein
MRTHAVIAAALLAAAPVAFAEGGNSPNDPNRTLFERHQDNLRASGQVPVQWGGPGSWNGPPRECWNPRAGHYEGVRENEFQNDLDYSQCRIKGSEAYYGNRYYQAPAPGYAYDDRAYAGKRECWNPRARHFEGVREGEFQDDLDYSRCRLVREWVEPAPRRYYYYGGR